MRGHRIALLVACLIAIVGLAARGPAVAQSSDEDLSTLNGQFLQLYRAGKYPAVSKLNCNSR
jgi:hypothetical protein